MAKRGLLLTVSLLAFGACDLAPDFKMPEIDLPAAFKEAPAAAPVAPATDGKWQRFDGKAKLDETAWWQLFNDPVLNAFEEAAMKDNPSLDAALARVDAARAAAKVARADLFPAITAGAGPTRQQISPASINAQFPAGVTKTKPFTLYDVRGTVTYDVDLFDKYRNNAKAVGLDSRAVQQNYRAARLALQADLAQAYFTYAAYTKELDVLTQMEKAQSQLLGLTRKKREIGAIDDLQVAAQETDLATTQQAKAQVAQAKAAQEHLIAILVGKPPASFAMEKALMTGKPPEVPVGLPSALLERRPDIQAAAEGIAAANARIGVARAGYFPDLSLTAMGGFTSDELGTLFNWSNRSWLIGPLAGTMLTQPIFQGGRVAATVAERKADYQEAVANYRGAVLQAFREVEDQLSGLKNLSDEARAANQAVKSSKRGYDIAKQRYDVGYSSYLEYLDAQRNFLNSQRAQVQVQGNRYVTTVQLIRALGGRWDAPVEKVPAEVDAPPVATEESAQPASGSTTTPELAPLR
jgi:multidrug efflux system outer membrane protein